MVHKPIKRKPARIRIKGLPAELDDLVGFDLPKLGTEMELAVLWENLKQEAFSILEDKFIVETSEKGQAFDTATVAKFKAIRSATVSHALNPKCPSATNLSERQDSLLTSRTTTARLALLRAVVQMEAAQEDAEAEKLNARKSPETSTPASAMGSPRTHRGKGAGRKSSKSPGEDKKFAEQGPRSLEPEPVHAIVSHHPPSHIPLEDRLRLACITSKWHPVAAGNASVATAAQRTFEVLGSRRRLTDISSVVRSRIEDREYTEVAENGNKLPTIKVEFVEDDARYKGKGTVVMNHLTPTVLTAFVAYANEPTVRQNELVARGELFRRKNNLSAMSDAKKELDSDRLEKLVCLRELEKLHKSRTLAQLEEQYQMELARMRESHQAAVDMALWKLRRDFEGKESQVDNYYKAENLRLRDMSAQVNSQFNLDLTVRLRDLSEARKRVLPTEVLPGLLILAADFDAPALFDDVLSVMSEELLTSCNSCWLKSPFLSPGALRRIYSDCAAADLSQLNLLAVAKANDVYFNSLIADPLYKDDEIKLILRLYLDARLSNEARALGQNGGGRGEVEGGTDSERRERLALAEVEVGLDKALRKRFKDISEPWFWNTTQVLGSGVNFFEEYFGRLNVLLTTAHWLTVRLAVEEEMEQRAKKFMHAVTDKNKFKLDDLKKKLAETRKFSRLQLAIAAAAGEKKGGEVYDQGLLEEEIARRERILSNLKVSFQFPLPSHLHANPCHGLLEQVCVLLPYVYGTVRTAMSLSSIGPRERRKQHEELADDLTGQEQSRRGINKWFYEVHVGPLSKGTMMVGWDLQLQKEESGSPPHDGPGWHESERMAMLPVTVTLPTELTRHSSGNVQDLLKKHFNTNKEDEGPKLRASGCLWQNDGLVYHNGKTFQAGVGYAAGDVIGCGVDLEANMMYFVKNGVVVSVTGDRRLPQVLDTYEIKEVEEKHKTEHHKKHHKKHHSKKEKRTKAVVQKKVVEEVKLNHKKWEQRMAPIGSTLEAPQSLAHTPNVLSRASSGLKDVRGIETDADRWTHILSTALDMSANFNALGMLPNRADRRKPQVRSDALQPGIYSSVCLPLPMETQPACLPVSAFNVHASNLGLEFGSPVLVPVAGTRRAGPEHARVVASTPLPNSLAPVRREGHGMLDHIRNHSANFGGDAGRSSAFDAHTARAMPEDEEDREEIDGGGMPSFELQPAACFYTSQSKKLLAAAAGSEQPIAPKIAQNSLFYCTFDFYGPFKHPLPGFRSLHASMIDI